MTEQQIKQLAEQCVYCQKDIEEGQLSWHNDDGDAICESCYGDCAVCGFCEDIVLSSHVYSDSKGTVLCKSCASTASVCEFCERWIEQGDGYKDSNNVLICDSCSDDYHGCDSCGSWIGSDKYCPACEELLEDEEEDEEEDDSFIIPNKIMFPGDKVQIKKSVQSPIHGLSYPSQYEDIGEVTSIGEADSAMVKFTHHTTNDTYTWVADPMELKIIEKSKPAFWYQTIKQVKAKQAAGICPVCGSKSVTSVSCSHVKTPHCDECCVKFSAGILTESPYFGIVLNIPEDAVLLSSLRKSAVRVTSIPYTDAQKVWGIDSTISLTQQAADFYLLEDLYIDHPNNKEVWQERKAKTEFLATQFTNYLNMSIGGEVRHARRHIPSSYISASLATEPVRQILGFSPAGDMRSRITEWCLWKELQNICGVVPLIEGARDLFYSEEVAWRGSFGGEKWGKIADVLLLYLKGKVNATIFVDTTWGLKHNGSVVFDKIWAIYPSDLAGILDSNFNGYMEELASWASENIKNLRNKLLGKTPRRKPLPPINTPTFQEEPACLVISQDVNYQYWTNTTLTLLNTTSSTFPDATTGTTQ